MYVVFISDAGFAVDLYKSIQSFLFRFFPSLGKFLRLFFGFTSFNSMASSQPTGPIELILICIQTISCVLIRNKKTTIKYTMQIFAMYPLCMVLWCLLQGVPVVNYFHWTLYDIPILRLFHLTGCSIWHLPADNMECEKVKKSLSREGSNLICFRS